MKTSSKISLKFTLFTVVIVFFFGFGANMIFLHNWYGPAEAMLHAPGPRNQQMNKVLGRERGPQVEQFALISEEAKVVLESQWLRDIAKIGDRYFLFWQGPENVFITDVTHTIEAQENLLWIALYLLFIFAGLAYVVSLFFVKSALRSLHNLVDFAQHLDLDRLDQQIEIEGPDDDEIEILANTLNHSLQKLHVQAFSLKDFVAHASHELKTPLMAMSAEIDLAIKAKDFSSLHQVKIYLRSMNDLIEQLLLITKLESGGELTMKKEKIQHVVANMVEMVKKKYADKHLDRVVDIHEVLSKCHLSSFEMIVQNLLDNAAKYSQSG